MNTVASAGLRFLADESCDFSIVRALRALGYDVSAVAEITPRATDAQVVELALSGGRILLTEDKDFGRLVYSHGRKSLGVVLLRYPAGARPRVAADLAALIQRLGTDLFGRFIVLRPGRIRITRMPGGQ